MRISEIIFPLPLWLHIVFVIVSVGGLIFCYAKKHQRYELYMIIGIISTLAVYFAQPKIIFYLLGLEEFILLGLTIYEMRKLEKAQLKAEQKKDKTPDGDTQETAG